MDIWISTLTWCNNLSVHAKVLDIDNVFAIASQKQGNIVSEDLDCMLILQFSPSINREADTWFVETSESLAYSIGHFKHHKSKFAKKVWL